MFVERKNVPYVNIYDRPKRSLIIKGMFIRLKAKLIAQRKTLCMESHAIDAKSLFMLEKQ